MIFKHFQYSNSQAPSFEGGPKVYVYFITSWNLNFNLDGNMSCKIILFITLNLLQLRYFILKKKLRYLRYRIKRYGAFDCINI